MRIDLIKAKQQTEIKYANISNGNQVTTKGILLLFQYITFLNTHKTAYIDWPVNHGWGGCNLIKLNYAWYCFINQTWTSQIILSWWSLPILQNHHQHALTISAVRVTKHKDSCDCNSSICARFNNKHVSLYLVMHIHVYLIYLLDCNN